MKHVVFLGKNRTVYIFTIKMTRTAVQRQQKKTPNKHDVQQLTNWFERVINQLTKTCMFCAKLIHWSRFRIYHSLSLSQIQIEFLVSLSPLTYSCHTLFHLLLLLCYINSNRIYSVFAWINWVCAIIVLMLLLDSSKAKEIFSKEMNKTVGIIDSHASHTHTHIIISQYSSARFIAHTENRGKIIENWQSRAIWCVSLLLSGISTEWNEQQQQL